MDYAQQMHLLFRHGIKVVDYYTIYFLNVIYIIRCNIREETRFTISSKVLTNPVRNN